MGNDLVTVVVPIYNVEKYLNECVESIVNQTYKNLEIILVDDGSPDNCPVMCDEWAKKDGRIKVIHQRNGGLSSARNSGLKICRGKYVTFVDSDDWLDSDCVGYLYELVYKDNSDMSVCQHRVVRDTEILQEFSLETDSCLGSRDCLKKIFYGDQISTSVWAKMYKTCLFDIVHFPEGRLYEDIGTLPYLVMNCQKINVGAMAKYNYRMVSTSITHAAFNVKKFDLIEMTDKSVDDVLMIYSDLEKAGLRRKIAARFGMLNHLRDTRGYESERRKIINFIMYHRNSILEDKFTSKRDKVAILCLMVGYRFYRCIWSMYCKLYKERSRRRLISKQISLQNEQHRGGYRRNSVIRIPLHRRVA